MNRLVYLDYAAATPMDKKVLAAMQPYYSDKFFNPSALYQASTDVKQDLIDAKQKIATVLGVKSSEIIHTSGGSEANNLAICGVMDKFSTRKVLVSAIEHESLTKPAEKYNHQVVPINKQGIIELDQLENLITEEVVLISVMQINNELGTIQPLKKIAEIINRIKVSRVKTNNSLPLYLHSDACQAANLFDIQPHRLGVDLLSINGGKIYGPKSSGILYKKAKLQLEPQILGGGQQRGLRSGTESLADVIGFAEALWWANSLRKTEADRTTELNKEFLDGLAKISSKIKLNGSLKHKSPAIVNVLFEGVDNERLLYQLDELGIAVASGSACAAASQEPSRVLKAIGLTDNQAKSSLRFSFGRLTKKSDIDYTLRSIHDSIA